MNEDNKQEWWCSWCFTKVSIELCKKSLRSTYKCQNCFNLVKKCTAVGCKGLARHHTIYSEKVCAVHNHILKEWGAGTLNSNKGMCSWCFRPTEHRIVALKLVKRTTFKCQSCNNNTVHCRRCGAFARNDNQLCIKCQGVISSWESVVPKQLDREGWCSWCFEKGYHIFQQKNFVGRNTYMCDHCFLRTLPCIKCNIGMTRGGIAWDDKLCARCSWETGRGWEQVKQRKDMLIEEARNLDRIKADLSRDSVFRRKAMKHGLIRPFLLLVAMPPMLRNQVTSFLGWTIFTQKNFGDSHAECWQILSEKMMGITSRCSTSWEKANPLFHINWYEILIRVTKLAFTQDPSKNVPTELSSSKILEACRDSKNPLLPKLEEQVLVIIEQYILSQMTTEQREELTRELEKSTNLALLSQLISTKTGLTSKDALSYGYKIANQVLGLQSSVATAMYAETTKWLALSTKPIIVALLPAVAAGITFYSTFLATPLFLLGILGLVKTGISLVFGSSEGRLIVPMITILNQRILLALEDIRIEDYY